MPAATLTPPTVIAAQPGPQSAFLASAADVCIFGGSAGGGKTWAELLEPLRHVHNGRFMAVVFRRNATQIRNPGGLWDKSMEVYPLVGSKPTESVLEWDFPSGAKVKFAHLEHESDKLSWQGTEIPLLEFDELCHFSEGQFWYLMSRNRSMSGVRPYVRATCNPDPDSWVAQFVDWWIGEDGYAIPERSGVLRWFVRANDEIVWADSPAELAVRYPGIPPKSATFILSTLWDNKALMARDPGYLATLMALPLVERERLLGDRQRGGNWKIRASAGKVFNRSWFPIVEAAPAGGRECRFWDFAATSKELKGGDPDYTASCRMRLVDGVFYILDATAEQLGPADVDRAFANLTRQDAATVGGRYCVRWEIEPGSAGIRENLRLVQSLAGIDAGGRHVTGDKLTRARPLAAQAEAGNVRLVRGAWNERWLRHMHAIPDGAHDDEMDAAAGALSELATPVAKPRPMRWG